MSDRKLGTPWGHFLVIFGGLRGEFGGTLGTPWGHSGDILVPISSQLGALGVFRPGEFESRGLGGSWRTAPGAVGRRGSHFLIAGFLLGGALVYEVVVSKDGGVRFGTDGTPTSGFGTDGT